MNKNEKLTKKERKYYTALLEKKLLAMGLKDESVMTTTGVYKPYFRTTPEGKVNIIDGKPEIVSKEMLTAKNPLRSMIKRLRNSPRSAVEAFLSLENKALVVPPPTPVPTPAPEKQEGILIDKA